MFAPCYNCTKRNPPCHDTCEKYKEFKGELKEIKETEKLFNYGRSVVIESSLRQTLSKMK